VGIAHCQDALKNPIPRNTDPSSAPPCGGANTAQLSAGGYARKGSTINVKWSTNHAGGNTPLRISITPKADVPLNSSMVPLYQQNGNPPNYDNNNNDLLIPENTPAGIYTLQWMWLFSNGDHQEYYSCAEIRVATAGEFVCTSNNDCGGTGPYGDQGTGTCNINSGLCVCKPGYYGATCATAAGNMVVVSFALVFALLAFLF